MVLYCGISTDYICSFSKDSRTYCITRPGTFSHGIEDISALQMQKLLQQDCTMGAVLYHIKPELVSVHNIDGDLADSLSSNLTTQQQVELNLLLAKYELVFVTPNALPPHGIQDHMIPLLEGSKPPNSRPYRYGPMQKTKKNVQDLLNSGFIRVSNSPYSSPVILVRKKEGTWRVCMDYKGLMDHNQG